MFEIYRNHDGEASLIIGNKISLMETNYITSKTKLIEFPTEEEAQDYLRENHYEKE